MVFRFGACYILLHDQGREFCNKLVEDLLLILNMESAKTSAYHPQTNGLTERLTQTLITHLMKLVNNEANDWDELLDPVAFAYRINKQASTKYSPFEIMYGVKAQIPIDLENQTREVFQWDTKIDEAKQGLRMKDFAEKIGAKRNAAKENIAMAQNIQKKRYDIKHSSQKFAVGDKVLKCNRRKDTRMRDKLAQRFHGPYTIIEVLDKGVYRLQDKKRILKQTVNGINLKRWSEQRDTAMSNQSDASDQNNDEVIATETIDNQQMVSKSEYWISKYNLTIGDKQILFSNAWLNDRIIDAVNKMVSTHLGNKNIQSTLLVQTRSGFKAVTCESIIIFHDVNHWVTTACIDREVLYLDSLHGSVSNYVKTQMRQLYFNFVNTEGFLPVTVVPCALQPNASDCGVYAAAFAFQLVIYGKDGTTQTFKNKMMRSHLISCLETSIIKPFPITILRKGEKNKAMQTIHI
ncbi:uncharacterized protein LOC100211930 isoform X2 [Hydra vulgaris]|uniref:Uncharacterized protein LOC100211930 isoform X2 n=1 Tax=Hydra vulgaris TaxID=6087 RepID=A0ABM4DIT2_HYDVU